MGGTYARDAAVAGWAEGVSAEVESAVVGGRLRRGCCCGRVC